MKKKLLLAALSIIVLAVVGVGLVNIKKSEAPASGKQAATESSDDAAAANEAEISETTETAAMAEGTGAEWLEFKSAQGISFRYPKRVEGTCDGSGALVDTKVFDDVEDGRIYVSADCAANLESLRQLSQGAAEEQSGGYKQEKFFYGWNLAVASVESEAELDGFVKQHYGQGCAVFGREPAAEDGVFDIKLNGYKDAAGNDTDLGSTVCPTNYRFELLYAPEKHLALSLVLGQEPTFCVKNFGACYDDEMAGSIKFD